jgi:hypothetical protein
MPNRKWSLGLYFGGVLPRGSASGDVRNGLRTGSAPYTMEADRVSAHCGSRVRPGNDFASDHDDTPNCG